MLLATERGDTRRYNSSSTTAAEGHTLVCTVCKYQKKISSLAEDVNADVHVIHPKVVELPEALGFDRPGRCDGSPGGHVRGSWSKRLQRVRTVKPKCGVVTVVCFEALAADTCGKTSLVTTTTTTIRMNTPTSTHLI